MVTIIQIKFGETTTDGKITYEEGDLIEAIFPETVEVKVGEQVNCVLKNDYETVQVFEAVVLAKDDNRLILFSSPTAAEYREQRRRYPRFDVHIKGWLQYPSQDASEKFAITNHMIEMVNISLGGLAFRSEKELPVKEDLLFFMELYGRNRDDGLIRANIDILHEKTDEQYLYGCKIKTISSKHFHNLRRYLLKRQLEELDERKNKTES